MEALAVASGGPASLCLFISHFLSLAFSHTLSLSLSLSCFLFLSLYPFLSLSPSLSLSVSLSLLVSLYLSLFPCISRKWLPSLSLSLDQLISWWDVASWTFWRKSIRSSASLPAWVVVMSIQSFMSCSHLLVGLPLPLLPSILASKMCLSSVSWRLMWPKYLSFSAFAFCRSIVVFISNLESTSLLVTFSIQDILKIFL